MPSTITHTPTVEKYAKQIMQIRAMLENLSEFADSLPAPNNDENLPGMHYGHIGTLDHVHTLLTQASEACDEFCDE